MSDIIYKIFPRYYYPKYTDDQIKRAAGMLKMTSNGRITFTNYKSVQFIDCAGALPVKSDNVPSFVRRYVFVGKEVRL